MRKQKRSQGVEHKCPDFSLDDSSVKSDAALKDPLHESPTLSALLSSERIREFKTKKIKKKKKTKTGATGHDGDQGNVNGCGTSESTFSSKNSAPAFHMPIENTIQHASTDAVMRQSCVGTDICLRENEIKEQNMLAKASETSDDLGQGVEHKGPDFSLDDSIVKTDAAIKDPLHESPALPDLSDSETIGKFKTKRNRKRKKIKTEHNAAKSDVNDSGTPENSFSSKNPTPALDMRSEHALQCVSAVVVMTQSQVETDICLRENEEKEQNVLIKAAETSDDLGQGLEHKGLDCSLDESSVKTDAAIKNPLHESPALPDLSNSDRIGEFKTKKNRKRKNTKTKDNVAISNVNGSGTPENIFSSKDLTPALDMPSEHAIQCVAINAVMGQSCVEAHICLGENEKEQNMPLKAAETSGDLGQGVEHKGPDFSLDDSIVKTDADIKDPLTESPALPDLSQSERIGKVKTRNRKRKKMKTEHNAAKSNVNGSGTPENSFSSKNLTSAFDMPSEHAIQCVPAGAIMRQSRVETDICLGETEEKEQNMLIKAVETSDDLGQGVEHKGPDFSLDDSSVKTDAAIKNPLHESPALPDLSNSQRIGEFKAKKNRKRKKTKTEHNVAKSNANGSDTPETSFSSKNLTPTLDICLGENEEKEQKMLIKAGETSDDLGQGVEHKAPDFSIDDSSLKTDAAMNEPLHESPALPDLSNSERIAEFKTKKNRKMKKTKAENNVAKSNVNGSGTPENNSSKDLTPALDVPSEHTIQCASSDAIMRQSCVERDICLGENEEKEQSMLTKAAEKSSGECDIQDEDCNSVGANPELFAKESVLEVVKLNNEQSINDICSNPKERNGSVKDGSPAKKHDKYLAVNDYSDEFQCVKTDTRTKVLNSSYCKNEDCPIAVNCNKEPTMQDHLMDDLHKFSDGPSTDDLIEIETEHLRDQVTLHSGVADQEMELMTVDNSEETSARQLDHAEITRNDLCCPGDVSDLSLATTASNGNSKISQFSLDRTIVSNPKNKLLILDVNGLLADCVSAVPSGYQLPEPDFWLRRKRVYKRPFCDDFLQFCFDRFHVGVWSSRAKCNVDDIIKFLMGESASKLLFCWSQSQCTATRFTTVENKDKPLVLKELKKLWENRDPNLPWKRGVFNESNTLLLDDSPYKALVNPMHTGVFPYSYRYYDDKDSSLGPGGDLRVYLEGLATAENVQEYVASNPFGQRPIREANPSWGFYCKVIEEVKARKKKR